MAKSLNEASWATSSDQALYADFTPARVHGTHWRNISNEPIVMCSPIETVRSDVSHLRNIAFFRAAIIAG
jgi:hypothetical protein